MTDRLEHNADHRLDELVPQLYRLAVECEWQDFRVLALQRIVEWSGASAAAWLTRSEGQSGEYSVFPSDLILDSRAVAALTLDHESSLRVSPVPAALVARPAQGARQVVAHRHLHANSELSSVLVLYLGDSAPATRDIGRALLHLAEAAAVSLHQYIQRDEWLLALGRTNRGSAAVVDARGVVYAASKRFRDLIAVNNQADTHFARLPFAIPAPALEGDESFFNGPLHFRISRLGGLYQLHARRPMPLDGLSPREQQIARALGNGKTFKSVARQYDIAVSTVANHASRIYRKLGIYRREDLVDLVRRPQAEPSVVAGGNR